jgi:signal transduction histidine kinase
MEKKLELNNLDIFLKKNQLGSLISTLESDRKRIAHELHDDISSKLNVISLNCHLLKIPNLSPEESEEITQNIIEYTSRALNSSKKMAHSLLPPVLDKFGLHVGIEELCTELSSNESVAIQYENKLKFDLAENESHIHVFRILQELLANSIQHGKATSISVLFDEINGKRACIYSDNGIGFDLKKLKNQNGLGMKNIASRIAILDGSITIESQLNNGISVIFNF